MLFLLNSYSRVRFLLEDYKYDIKESFNNLNKADINLYVMSMEHSTGEYELMDQVPVFGHIYDEEFSYCENGSTITYLNGNISVTASGKDSCYAYFVELERDIVLKIYKKESETSERVLVNNIPNRAYSLTSSSCTKGSITFNGETRRFKISSSEKTVCEVEFTKNDLDININVYKEDASGSHTHIIDNHDMKFELVNNIPPSNYEFHSFVCENAKTIIKEENGELVVDAYSKDTCNVYYLGGSDKVGFIMMQENTTGDAGYTTGKKYTRIYQIPSSSYSYVGYICDDVNASVTYSNGKFIGENATQTTCYLYFDLQ